jgi:hypothetical protein
MSRRKVLTAFCVFISITLLVSIVKYWPQPSLPPRPMFYNVFGPPKMGRDTWLPEYPISDQHGAHAYYDTHLNILVILVLDNPEIRAAPVRKRTMAIPVQNPKDLLGLSRNTK